jgi:hypothetical protein
MLHARTFLGVAVACFVLSGCYRGYKSAKDLDSDDRGPKACAASCKELGMTMSAFVLVEHQTSGCVCTPEDKQTKPSGEVAAAAASQVVIQEEKRDAAQRRQEQTVTGPP